LIGFADFKNGPARPFPARALLALGYSTYDAKKNKKNRQPTYTADNNRLKGIRVWGHRKRHYEAEKRR
jgi:hypothetical protein